MNLFYYWDAMLDALEVPHAYPVINVLEQGNVPIEPIRQTRSSTCGAIAARMRSTLIDVLGDKKGANMYSMDWLVERVQWHLDLGLKAKIFLAESNQEIVAHAIVRTENSNDGEFGYFSTIYVAPEFRNKGIAKTLIKTVESWCRQKHLPYMAYNTAENNFRLIELFKNFSFEIIVRESEMVQLKKLLE